MKTADWRAKARPNLIRFEPLIFRWPDPADKPIKQPFVPITTRQRYDQEAQELISSQHTRANIN